MFASAQIISNLSFGFNITKFFLRFPSYSSNELTTNFAGDMKRCPEVMLDAIILSILTGTISDSFLSIKIHKIAFNGLTQRNGLLPHLIDLGQANFNIAVSIILEAISLVSIAGCLRVAK